MQLTRIFCVFKNMFYVDRLQSPSAGSTFAPIAAPAASARTVSATGHSTVRISAAAGARGRPALLQRAAAGPGVGSASGAGRAANSVSAGGGQWVGGKSRRWQQSAHQSPFLPPLGRCTAVPGCSARAGAESCAAAALPPAHASAPPPPPSRGRSRRQGRAVSPGEPQRPAPQQQSSSQGRLWRDHHPQCTRCCLRMQLHAPPPPAPPRRHTVSCSDTSAVPKPARPATTAAANAHADSPASGGGDGVRT
jgi:hypothetical protein